MEAIIKGNFVKNDSIKKKDGTVLNVAIVLAGNETVQINNMMFGADVKPLQPVELRVNIKNSQYGLYITPVTNNYNISNHYDCRCFSSSTNERLCIFNIRCRT